LAQAPLSGIETGAALNEFSSIPPLPAPEADFARHAKPHAGLFFLRSVTCNAVIE
jgi:hypothetical protein